MSGGLTKFDYEALKAVQTAAASSRAKRSQSFDAQKGWLTVTEIVEFTESDPKSHIRPALLYLTDEGYLKQKAPGSIRHFRITEKGESLLKTGFIEAGEAIRFRSSSWTGIVEPIQARRVLVILAEMEDVCENIRNNHDRAQIFGLIRALELLMTIPEPPRQGVASLVRDPAFANIVQVGTFLAAIIAAVKP